VLRIRVIPCLLLHNGGLVKTVRFRRPTYVGDPINAIKIFNDKEVDELALIDIDASRQGRGPDFALLERVNKEAFMPLACGGGIRTPDHVRRVLGLGYEKVILDSVVLGEPGSVEAASAACGSQSVVVCIDTKRDLFGRLRVYDHLRRRCTRLGPGEYARLAQARGAGEVIVYSVDSEGTFQGYDVKAVREVSDAVTVPVVALGGAGKLQDFADVVRDGGATAVAAGSFFVFHGPHRAVLITYPERQELERVFGEGRGE